MSVQSPYYKWSELTLIFRLAPLDEEKDYGPDRDPSITG